MGTSKFKDKLLLLMLLCMNYWHLSQAAALHLEAADKSPSSEAKTHSRVKRAYDYDAVYTDSYDNMVDNGYYEETDAYQNDYQPVARIGYSLNYGGKRKTKKRKPKKRGPKVVHILDCHDGHSGCHADGDQHVISFDKHDDDHYDYHDDHGDYGHYSGHDHDDGTGTYMFDYHDDHDSNYHDPHGFSDHDYHDYDDHHHDSDYHDDHHGGGYGGYGSRGKGVNVYRPKVVVIKKIISQSTTTIPPKPA